MVAAAREPDQHCSRPRTTVYRRFAAASCVWGGAVTSSRAMGTQANPLGGRCNPWGASRFESGIRRDRAPDLQVAGVRHRPSSKHPWGHRKPSPSPKSLSARVSRTRTAVHLIVRHAAPRAGRPSRHSPAGHSVGVQALTSRPGSQSSHSRRPRP